LITEL